MSLYLGNDHVLYLLGLRAEADWTWEVGATVSASVLDEPGGSTITGGGPVSMAYQGLSTDTIGGTTADPTVVKSTSKMDLEVSVGATTGLSLSAGRFLYVMHDIATIWRVRRDVTITAGTDGWIHLEPFQWPGAKPTKVKATTGELVEILDGVYKGTLDAAFSAEAGVTYYVEFTVTAPGGLDAKWYEEAVAAYR